MCDIIGQVVSQAISRRGFLAGAGMSGLSALFGSRLGKFDALYGEVFEAMSLLINKCFHRLSLSTKMSLIPASGLPSC